MCEDYPAELPRHAPVCPHVCLARPVAWGDVAADQADGFAGPDLDLDTEPWTTDLDDDRGYGHGV